MVPLKRILAGLLFCAACTSPFDETDSLSTLVRASGRGASPGPSEAPSFDGSPGSADGGECLPDPIRGNDCEGLIHTHTPGGSPELNVIGIYQPHTQEGGEAQVRVVSGGPMVLVLSSYHRTHWNVTVEADAVIERLLLTGYEFQTASAPDGFDVESLVFQEGDTSWATGHTWPYDGGGSDTSELFALAEAYADRKLTAFLGCYAGADFTVGAACCQAPTCTAPTEMMIECAGLGGSPLSDPAVQGWLNGATSAGGCGAVTITHDAPAVFPAGCADRPQTTLVTFTAVDEEGNRGQCSSSVGVVDTTSPAVALDQKVACLWPPNHEFVDVATLDVTDVCDVALTVDLEATSDEAAAAAVGAGGPRHCPDVRLAPGSLQLRAERSGPADSGRVYGSVSLTARDSCGNEAAVALTPGTAAGCSGVACVPHDQGRNSGTCAATDDGQGDAITCD
jgi:hypothetical protein